jgi:hypothetical protein
MLDGVFGAQEGEVRDKLRLFRRALTKIIRHEREGALVQME